MKLRKLSNPDQLLPLARVIKTRLASAERTLQKELESLKTIELEILERQGKVEALQQDLLQLQNFLSNSHECITSKSDKAESTISPASIDAMAYQRGLDRRYWINYDLERENYYLQLTYDEHTEQLPKVAHARQKYKALQCKCGILDDSLHAAQKSRQTSALKKQEADRQVGMNGFGGLNGRLS